MRIDGKGEAEHGGKDEPLAPLAADKPERAGEAVKGFEGFHVILTRGVGYGGIRIKDGATGEFIVD